MRKFSLLHVICCLSLAISCARADVSHLTHVPTSSHYRFTAPQQQQQQHSLPYKPRSQVFTVAQLNAIVTRQFAAPALEQAAFTQALTKQGYVYGDGSVLKPAATFTAAASTGRSASSIITSADAKSLNLKLPVPFGITPLNVAQLPLQAGAPYSALPHVTGLNSYGTLYPQKR